jgi:hypothetical protein
VNDLAGVKKRRRCEISGCTFNPAITIAITITITTINITAFPTACIVLQLTFILSTWSTATEASASFKKAASSAGRANRLQQPQTQAEKEMKRRGCG